MENLSKSKTNKLSFIQNRFILLLSLSQKAKRNSVYIREILINSLMRPCPHWKIHNECVHVHAYPLKALIQGVSTHVTWVSPT